MKNESEREKEIRSKTKGALLENISIKITQLNVKRSHLLILHLLISLCFLLIIYK